MPLVLTPLARASAGPLSIDLGGILPDRLARLSIDAILGLIVRADGRPCRLGDLFSVAGDTSDERIECHGDFSRVHRVAAGLSRGRVDVAGPVGRHAGEGMSGGTLRVGGNAGDWLACGMTDGDVFVSGAAGDHAAAALPGSADGLRGGRVVIGGSAGCLAGARMRRGMLAIGGDCGTGAAFEMRAGTVVVGGRVGRHAALGMRRGSLVALTSPPDIPPTFRPGAAWRPAFLPLMLRRLAAVGFPTRAAGTGTWRQWHGDALAGGRGEILHPA